MGSSTTTRLCCLIVEDEPLIGMELEDAVGAAGYEPLWVCSEDTAILAIKGKPPDVAIVDLRLHNSFCAELVRELRHQNIPFVVHTGSAPEDGPAEVLDVPWLSKPAERSTILRALDSVLQKSEELPAS